MSPPSICPWRPAPTSSSPRPQQLLRLRDRRFSRAVSWSAPARSAWRRMPIARMAPRRAAARAERDLDLGLPKKPFPRELGDCGDRAFVQRLLQSACGIGAAQIGNAPPLHCRLTGNSNNTQDGACLPPVDADCSLPRLAWVIQFIRLGEETSATPRFQGGLPGIGGYSSRVSPVAERARVQLLLDAICRVAMKRPGSFDSARTTSHPGNQRER